ncbi:YdcF family protein [Alicyclobacillus cycloheptanicus]|uniref:YdcF family protein n=1 Tax=Alicyclobacillus cycloheptanicus TaxID=1457 RepID=UPI002377D2C1|nr:YdcF family protein [Alicyclobacillus cycloheptanicus]
MIYFICAGSACVVLLAFGFLRAAAYGIRRQGRRERPLPADTGIVLGAYTDGYRPSDPLVARLRAALHLYRHGYVRVLIVSGGRGEDETVAESSSMKRFLILNGVPPEVILEDRRSRDTWENLRNSMSLMQTYHLKTAVIITSDYHLPRALAVARQLGMNATGYAAWSTQRELRTAYREVLARIKYTVTGQAAI